MKNLKYLIVVLMALLAFSACGKESTDTALIDSFLKGESSAVVSEDFKNELTFCLSELDYETFDTKFILPDSFTIDDMISGIEGSEYATEAVISTDYYISQTANGKNVLFLRINGLNLYYPDDGSFSFYAFVEKDGQLELTFACDSYYANELEIDDDLSFVQTGFDNSGTSFSRRGMINADGQYEFVYNLRLLSGDSIGIETIENYSNIGEFTEEDSVDWLSTSTDVYYCIHNLSGNEEKYADIIAQIENMGATLADDTDTTIAQVKENAGLKGDSVAITEWITLQ